MKELDNGNILFWRGYQRTSRGSYLIIPRQLLVRVIEVTHPKDPPDHISQLITEWPAVNKITS